MNCLPESKVFNGEIMSPGDTVTVLVARHPFAASTRRYEVARGSSLAEMLDSCFPLHGTTPLVCYIVTKEHEDIIPADWWPRIRPKKGTVVVFRAVAEGKYAKSLFTIGIAILAIAVAVFLPILFPALTLTLGSVVIGAAGIAALAAGAITIAGSIAAQMMFPAAKKKQDTSAATEAAGNVFSISGAQNQARPFESVPVVLGHHKLSPPYGGQPYTEYIGNDQFLTVVFCVGYGPLNFTEYKIGETPIENFALAAFEARNGVPGEAGISFYPSAVHQEDFSIKLTGGSVITRSTQDDIDQISIDFQAPEGLQQFYPETGIRGNVYVTFNIYYRLLPSGGFIPFAINLTPFSYGLNALRQGYTWNVPRGQYEVQITRTYPEIDNVNVKDDVFWSALRSTRFENPFHFEQPLALAAMKIKATDQLSGVISTFNLVASSYGQMFNGTAWVYGNSSNPADLFRMVLQGAPNKQPVPDSRIDLEALQAWWYFCVGHGFTYNAVIEAKRSVYSVIAEICSAGRAVPTWKDGKWSVIWDSFDSPIVQHFTPRNSRDFKGERIYKRMPHGLRVRFIDGTNGYVEDEVIVYDDGYYAGNATLFEAVEFPGITDPALIYKHGRYQIAQARLRPEIYTLAVDIEHMRCTRGDRVRVQHDIALIGQVSGRIVSVEYPILRLDETVIIEAGKEYAIRWRTADGNSLVTNVVGNDGEWNYVTITANNPGLPAVGDLFMFGERELESAIFRVFKIEHQNDFEARLTLVDDAPEIINADTRAIPEFQTHISQPVDAYHFPPRNLSVIEILHGSGDQASAYVRFSWTPTRAALIVAYEAQIKDETHPAAGWYGTQLVMAPQQFTDFTNILLGTYSFRVRARFEDNTVSVWVELNSKEITAPHLTSALPDVTNFRSAYVDGVTSLRWDQIIDFRPILYEIRRGDNWEAALLMGTFSQPPFAAHGLGKYWISAVTRPIQGLTIYSPHPTLLDITGARLVDNVVASWDEKALSWPGVFTGTAARSGAVIRTGGSNPFLAEPDFLGIASLFESGGSADGNYYMPDVHTIDAGYIVRAAVTIDYDGTGDAAISSALGGPVSFLDNPDFLGSPDFLGASSARFVEVYPLVGVKNAIGDAWSWQRWQPGVYVARYFTGAMILRVLNPQISAYALSFKFTVDVPDRIERYSGLSIGTGGLSIVFQPEGSATAAPYHGGPNGATTPNVQVAILNSVAGDIAVVSAKTLTGCTVRITNGGVGVARNVDLVIQGY